MNREHLFGLCLVVASGFGFPLSAAGQDREAAAVPDSVPLPAADGLQQGGNPFRDSSADSKRLVKPLMEGPLHEAFLSPRKDRDPSRVEKAPPPPLSERPGIEPPSATAEWIQGYWEWDAGRKDFVWVTGTWRVSLQADSGSRLLEAGRQGLVSSAGILERTPD